MTLKPCCKRRRSRTIAASPAAQATEWLRATGYERTFRDNVLTGLSLKIDGSFRALIDDARAGRVEAMHHLKTMVESFIYFYVVAADTSPETATAERLSRVI
jgi:hypothetical protein